MRGPRGIPLIPPTTFRRDGRGPGSSTGSRPFRLRGCAAMLLDSKIVLPAFAGMTGIFPAISARLVCRKLRRDCPNL